MSDFTLQRLGVIMEPEAGNPHEAEGVLNPAAVRGPDGQLYLFPRLVAAGNFSRIGIARVKFNDAGDPCGVERLGIALEPAADYELVPHGGGGCEDPRITFLEPLRLYVMTYSALSTIGPRIAVAVSRDLFHWTRLGLVTFEPYRGIDFAHVYNKDASVFPVAVPNHAGKLQLALLHRPLFPGTLPEETVREGESRLVDLDHESIWISYCPMPKDSHEPKQPGLFNSHHRLATPTYPWEMLKIGGGTPPMLTRHGWMIVYHGVHEVDVPGGPKHPLCYSAGVMILAKEQPHVIRYRSAKPVLEPLLHEERHGIVPNVVFPTGIDRRDDLGQPDRFDVYYGMADSRIGVARVQVPPTIMTQVVACIFMAIAMLELTACVGKGTRQMAADAVVVPARWKQGASSSKPLDVALWWRRFRDPVLNDLIAEALKASPTVRSALEKVTEYRARRGVESANLFPSLYANQSGRGARTKSGITDIITTSESYKASFDVSWQVDLFGKQFQTLKAATADLEQIGENFYGAQVTLAADVATAYVALRSAEAQLSVVQRSLGTRGETVQLTQWREQAGTGDALDTQRSISTLEQARASMPALQLSVVQSKNQLALLSGRTPGALDSRLAGSHRVPEMISRIAAGVPAEALRQRPDVRAAEHVLEAAFARTQSAKRARLPSLNLSGSIGIDALKAGNIFSPEAAIASILAGLATPVIDAGRIRQNIRAVSSRERQALIAYEAAVLNALAEVENALAAVRRYAEQHRIVEKAAAAAREAVTLAAWQYEAGQVDLLVSLDAQRTLLTLEQQEVTTTAQSANACVQLYKALGGGWSPF